MTAVAFDTLKFAGGPPSRADLQGLGGSAKVEFAAVRSEIAAFKSDTKGEFASVRSDMKLLDQRMTIKLGAILVALGGILIAAIRTMPVR